MDRRNEKTLIGTSLDEPDAAPSPPTPFGELFRKHYHEIRRFREKDNGSGVVLVAMDETAVRGTSFVSFEPDALSTAILGRHTMADFRLDGDASISLRHLALALFPKPLEASRGRYRLVDLRTATGFIDERGRRLRAIEADGPAFVRVGRSAVAVFPGGEADGPWPDDADEGWSQVPDRLYLDEVEAEERPFEWERDSDRAWEVGELSALKREPTLVHSVAGPEMASAQLVVDRADGDEALGELRIASSRGLATIVLGKRAASSGLLLGRSRRCDAGWVLSDRAISRVHLLLIEIGETLYAIDTASSHGVFQGKASERVLRLDVERKFHLSDRAVLTWHPAERAKEQHP